MFELKSLGTFKGRSVDYDETAGLFMVAGRGLSVDAVRAHAGDIEWIDPDTAEWLEGLESRPTPKKTPRATSTTPVSEGMKRCAKCGKEYAVGYDACPSCASEAKAAAGRWWFLGLLLATLVSAFVMPLPLTLFLGFLALCVGLIQGLEAIVHGIGSGFRGE